MGQPAPTAPPPKPKGKGCFTAVMVVLGGSMTCCCLGGLLAAAAGDTKGFDPGALLGPEVALGTVTVPPDTGSDVARQYHWRHRQRYGLGYGVSSDVRGDVDDAHAALAKRFSYRSTGSGPFTWIPPVGCQSQPWACVFNETARDSGGHIEPLTDVFREERRRAGLDLRQTAELVVTFVQHITYRLPTETFFELLPPELVVTDGSGDCDSKALLAAMLLKDLGLDTAMLYSRPLAHAALGVALPGTGKSFSAGGRKYLFVEVTYPGWAIGTIPPQYDKPKAWEVLPLR